MVIFWFCIWYFDRQPTLEKYNAPNPAVVFYLVWRQTTRNLVPLFPTIVMAWEQGKEEKRKGWWGRESSGNGGLLGLGHSFHWKAGILMIVFLYSVTVYPYFFNQHTCRNYTCFWHYLAKFFDGWLLNHKCCIGFSASEWSWWSWRSSLKHNIAVFKAAISFPSNLWALVLSWRSCCPFVSDLV